MFGVSHDRADPARILLALRARLQPDARSLGSHAQPRVSTASSGTLLSTGAAGAVGSLGTRIDLSPAVLTYAPDEPRQPARPAHARYTCP
jgi:hypothetical protein